MSFKSFIEEKPARAYVMYKIVVIALLGFFIIGTVFVSKLFLKEIYLILFTGLAAFTASLPLYNFLMSNNKTSINNIFRLLFHTDLYEVQWLSREFENFLGKDFEILNEIYNDYFRIKASLNSNSAYELSDYSCMVLPLAKAYEGVLKKILVRSGFISEADLQEDPDISINKYFNPVGNNAIFNALKDRARDKAIPYVIYSTYQECRNLIFHYDPYRDNRLKTIDDAEFYYRRITDAIKKAYETFQKIEGNSRKNGKDKEKVH